MAEVVPLVEWDVCCMFGHRVSFSVCWLFGPVAGFFLVEVERRKGVDVYADIFIIKDFACSKRYWIQQG